MLFSREDNPMLIFISMTVGMMFSHQLPVAF